MVGSFFTEGGAKAYLYGYEPNYLQDEMKCSWGNLMMLQLNPKSEKLDRLSTYYSTRLITGEWLQPGNQLHEIFPVTTDSTSVTIYAARRPDDQWSLLVINKNPEKAARLESTF